MKKSFFSWALPALLVLLISACGGDSTDPEPQKTPEQLAVEALTGTGSLTWAVGSTGSVRRGSTDVTDLYRNFALIMNSGSSRTYTTRNNNDLFDNSGNWAFAGSNFDKFTLTGTKPAASREISFTRSGQNLKLIFTIPAPGARINGVFAVAGNYEFNLIVE